MRYKAVAILCLSAMICLFGACAPQAAPTVEPTPHRTATATRPAITDTPTLVPASPTPVATATEAWTTYADPSYRLTLRYPSDWQFVPGYGVKYAGPDGFFQLGAISGPSASIDQIAEGDAYHKLQPYGSQPTIEPLQIDNQPARLILPSADQPAAMAGQAGLIVEPPQPIELSGELYNYVVLWADQGHVRQIAETVSLQSPLSAITPTIAPESAPEAVQRLLDTLSRRFRAKAAELQLLAFEYVTWPDGCLGVPMRGACTQATVPGFRVFVRVQEKHYEYRTDSQGSRILLAAAPAHGIASPALIWEGGDVCDTLLLSDTGRGAVGPCDAPLRPTQLVEGGNRMREWLGLFARFAPSEAETPSGRIVFRGAGQEEPSPAWQRAIAAWAALTHAELHSGRSIPSSSTVLTWYEEITGRPGYCRSLEVDSFGYAFATETLCEGGFTKIVGDGWLTTEELEFFDTWYYGSAGLETAEVSFQGRGSDPMGESDAQRLNEWVAALHARLAEA